MIDHIDTTTVIALKQGLTQPERVAVLNVYPSGWRDETSGLAIDRVLFVEGLRLLGLSQVQREAVMFQFNTEGVLAARLLASQYIRPEFSALVGEEEEQQGGQVAGR